MNANPTSIPPDKRRARIITTAEGKFLNLEDFKEALRDDAFVLECMAVMKAGIDMKAEGVEILRRTIGCAVMILAGEEKVAERLREKMEQKSNQP